MSYHWDSFSQMPRHLVSDALEWIDEIPTVSSYFLAKPLPRKRAWSFRNYMGQNLKSKVDQLPIRSTIRSI